MHLNIHPQLESADESKNGCTTPLLGGSGGWGLGQTVQLVCPTLASCAKESWLSSECTKHSMGKDQARWLTPVSSFAQRALRSSTAGSLQRSKDNAGSRLCCLPPELWNMLPLDIKEASSLDVFQRQLKAWFSLQHLISFSFEWMRLKKNIHIIPTLYHFVLRFWT